MSKYPLGGLSLSTRIKWGNPPDFIFIYVGGEPMNLSKTAAIFNLQLHHEQQPEKLIWPVAGIPCLIIWDIGPSAKQVKAVYDALKLVGAGSVNIISKQINYEKPTEYYEKITGEWAEPCVIKSEINKIMRKTS